MKCGWWVSDTAGRRWRRQRRTELDGDELSEAYAPPGVTRHKSSKSSQDSLDLSPILFTPPTQSRQDSLGCVFGVN